MRKLNQNQIAAIAIAAVIVVGLASFVAGVEYQKAAGPVPADIVIVGVNASDEMIQSDIQPITQEHGVRFPVSQTVTEYRLTYGH